MAIAAVPRYFPAELLNDASPGLRFGMYLKLWGIDHRTKALLWTTHDVKYEARGADKRERPLPVENKRAALDFACSLTSTDRHVMQALWQRQQAVSAPLAASGALMRLEAAAVAPFTTGLGNEHPLENGFAFVNPYGLPYLPGSGVKGVVRQAGRELASGDWGDPSGWSYEPNYRLRIGNEDVALSSLDVLFGPETETGQTGHIRGALSFWDVIPIIEGDRLTVEVMTAHQTHYYQDGKTPHESGSPNPINFLTVPPRSRFAFHVLCDRRHLRRLAPPLADRERWRELIGAAFAHAFQWLGFGAKTSVGYGALEQLKGAAAETATKAASQERQAASVSSASEAVWRGASLSWNAGGGGRLTIRFESRRAEAVGGEAQRLLQPFSPEMIQQIKKSGFKADVRVAIEGNMARAIEIIVPRAKEQ